LSIFTRIRLFHLIHFSKPQSDRPVYRAINRQRFRKIVELGVASTERARRAIRVAAKHHPLQDVSYVGIDLFEARSPDHPGLSLKEAYRALRPSGAKIQLLPGEPADSLIRAANDLGKIDLLIFSAGVDPNCMPRLWAYIPRLLHPDSQIFIEHALPENQYLLQRMERAEVDMLAAAAPRRAA
jgi:hypothetical protein